MKQIWLAVAVLLLLAASLYASTPATEGFAGDVFVGLTHVDAGKQMSRHELMRRAMQRSKARAAALSVARNNGLAGKSAQSDVPLRPSGNYEYLIDLAIGTPPQPVWALLDTGSDLIWTQCAPCKSCLPQPDPLFSPGMSSSYKPMGCSGHLCKDLPRPGCQRPDTCTYFYQYGDGTTTLGVYATDRFTFTSSSGEKLSVPLGFGCGSMNSGSLNNGSGIVGFGRNPLSLVSQLSIRRFSYCLTPYTSAKKSTLMFGCLAGGVYHNATGPVQTTKLLQSRQDPTFYYVPFTGVTVGARRLPIPMSAFALRPDGSGGVFVDSGSAFTSFPKAVHAEVVSAFHSQLRLPSTNGSSPELEGLPCFKAPAAAGRRAPRVPVPRMVFHFQGADLELPRQNYVQDDQKEGTVCLLLDESGDSRSIIGNVAQQNMRVLYDLGAETLSFAPERC